MKTHSTMEVDRIRPVEALSWRNYSIISCTNRHREGVTQRPARRDHNQSGNNRRKSLQEECLKRNCSVIEIPWQIRTLCKCSWSLGIYSGTQTEDSHPANPVFDECNIFGRFSFFIQHRTGEVQDTSYTQHADTDMHRFTLSRKRVHHWTIFMTYTKHESRYHPTTSTRVLWVEQ